MEVGARIANLRTKRGISQTELGELLGTTKQTVYKYESGIVTNIPLDRLERIADVLEVSPAYLMGWDSTPPATPYSDGALKLADDYDNRLDSWGRQAVRDLMETEIARVADESRFQTSLPEESEPKIISLYRFPAAAGYAAPVFNEDYEPYELKPEDPPGAAYAVRLQGDSMEPDFPDGSIVFVNHDAMAAGDIGIFSVDGATVCKQYYRDPAGFVYLFSLNRRRQDADLLISPGGNRTFICQGRVITRKRYPIPGKG